MASLALTILALALHIPGAKHRLSAGLRWTRLHPAAVVFAIGASMLCAAAYLSQ